MQGILHILNICKRCKKLACIYTAIVHNCYCILCAFFLTQITVGSMSGNLTTCFNYTQQNHVFISLKLQASKLYMYVNKVISFMNLVGANFLHNFKLF